MSRDDAMRRHPAGRREHDTTHACMVGECPRCPDSDLPE